MDLQTQTEIEAAAFRTLRDHLAKRTDVQNIDMMNLAGFCRNCLSRWYQEAAGTKGIEIFNEWKNRYQVEATDEQKASFKATHK